MQGFKALTNGVVRTAKAASPMRMSLIHKTGRVVHRVRLCVVCSCWRACVREYVSWCVSVVGSLLAPPPRPPSACPMCSASKVSAATWLSGATAVRARAAGCSCTREAIPEKIRGQGRHCVASHPCCLHGLRLSSYAGHKGCVCNHPLTACGSQQARRTHGATTRCSTRRKTSRRCSRVSGQVCVCQASVLTGVARHALPSTFG